MPSEPMEREAALEARIAELEDQLKHRVAALDVIFALATQIVEETQLRAEGEAMCAKRYAEGRGWESRLRPVQPRERAVPCSGCMSMTWRAGGVCQRCDRRP